MAGLVAVIYGVVAYGFTLVALLYLIGFVGSVERSTYVLSASFALLILYWQWQPIPALVWTVHNPTAAAVLDGIFWLGWVVLVASTFLLSHFELFGLSQVFARLFGKTLSDAKFRTPLLYRHVRHPIYLGILLAVWATPAMTVGHLLFSVVITGYILIGIQLEEHDLIQQFGDQYRRYRQHAAMLVPLPGRKFTGPKDADVYGDEVQLVETRQPHAEERATRASRSMGSKRLTDLS